MVGIDPAGARNCGSSMRLVQAPLGQRERGAVSAGGRGAAVSSVADQRAGGPRAGSGGVVAAMGNDEHGLIDNWLRNIQDIYFKYREQIEEIVDVRERQDFLCELNVLEQVANVCCTTIVQNAWKRGQELAIHGWIYGLKDGLLRDLGVTINALDQIPDVYRSSREIVTQYHSPDVGKD